MDLIEQMKALSIQFHAQRLCLFGSRARGDHRSDSDYDFALWGIQAEQQAAFLNLVEELPCLLKIDVVFVGPQTDPKLLESIEKEGITLMDKFERKYDNFKNAMARLQEGLRSYENCPGDTLIQDGIIQRFEFTCELAWKTTREYLLDQGYTDLNSPKSVMKQALADGLILDGDGWMALLTDRNLTSHLYDEASANQIFERIRTQHIVLLTALLEKLK